MAPSGLGSHRLAGALKSLDFALLVKASLSQQG